MNYTTIETQLQKQGLKRTKLRIALLSCLVASEHALSYFEIKKVLGEEVDKSTLYRNLSAFEEAGIIHRINDYSGVAKYAIGEADDHQESHAHFVCEECKTVYCIDVVKTEELKVPKGFKTKTVQTIVKGICSDC